MSAGGAQTLLLGPTGRAGGQEGVFGLLKTRVRSRRSQQGWEMPPGLSKDMSLGQQLLGLVQMHHSKFPAPPPRPPKPPRGCWHLGVLLFPTFIFGGLLFPSCLGESQEPPVQIAAPRGCIWSLRVYFWPPNIYFWPPNAMPRCCCWWGWGGALCFPCLAEGSAQTWLRFLGALVTRVGNLPGGR